MHEGDYAARGGVVIATSECGNYGEDTLTAWKLADGAVVVERECKDGTVLCWQIDATDTLRTSSEAWGSGGIVGLETDLVAIAQDGEEIAITHFEFSSPWGGASDRDVAMLAEAIANEARCTLDIVPTKYPESMTRKPEVAAPTPAPEPPPPQVGRREPLLADSAGAEVLASIVGGKETNEELRAIRLADGNVWIENEATGARWQITRDNTLWITPYVMATSSDDGVETFLEREPPVSPEQIAAFKCWADERKGPDEAAVAEFVAKVVAATGCKVVHRELVWP